MALLTYGELEAEVESLLRLQTEVDETSADGLRILALLNSVEARVRQVTGRAFVETSYTDEPIDVEDGTANLILPDRPVSTWVGIKQVLSYNDDGTVATTYTLPRSDYLVYADEGKLRMRSGCWPAGPQALLFSATLGYDADDLADAATDDLKQLKVLIGAILAREYKRFLEGVHHMNSQAFADGSTSFRTDLLPWEEEQLRTLRMRLA